MQALTHRLIKTVLSVSIWFLIVLYLSNFFFGLRFEFYFNEIKYFIFYLAVITFITSALIFWDYSDWIKKINKGGYYEKIRLSSKYFFIGGLLLIGLYQILDASKLFIDIMPKQMTFLDIPRKIFFLLTIISGLFTFCLCSYKKEEINSELKKVNSDLINADTNLFYRLLPSARRLKILLLHFNNWLTKDEKRFTYLMVFIVAIGFLLRLINLGKLGYSTDEGSTALYSFFINNTGLPCSDSICYLRGLPYLYFTSFFTKIFGVTEFWVRFPGVLITMTTVVILYFFIKKITNKSSIALLTVTLITFADWHFMLGRYARMYSLLLFFIILSFYFYLKTFHENNKKYIIPLILSISFALLTHPFGLLLIFLIFVPLFSGNQALYKSKFFLFFCFLLIISIFLALTKLPGNIYLDNNYLSLYDMHPEYIIADKYWYLKLLQKPDWTYINSIFTYFPLLTVILSSFFLYIVFDFRKQNNIRNLFLFFIVFVFIVMAVYKFKYSLKYLWWLLTIMLIPLSNAIYKIFKKNHRQIAIILILAIILSNSFGVKHILTRDYGKVETQFPILMSTHVEHYHPDDKTPIEYLKLHYKIEDVIINDYWIQNVYLQILMNRQSNYYISHLNTEVYVKKYPYYKLYNKYNYWKLSKNGPQIIASIYDLKKILEKNADKNIWYISSVDFVKKKHHRISQKSMDDYITKNYSNKIVYIGKDNNSKLYLLNNVSVNTFL